MSIAIGPIRSGSAKTAMTTDFTADSANRSHRTTRVRPEVGFPPAFLSHQ